MSARTPPLLAVAGTLLAAWPAAAQQVRGTVTARLGDTPVAGAQVTLLRARAATTTDGLGRFALAAGPGPDTLVVAAIGWAPDTLTLPAPPAGPLRLRLDRAPVVMSDLIVSAPARRPPGRAGQGGWRMPMAAARTVPPAVETDVFRALALVPAVSFSSPLSARPMLRGWDAAEVATRVDGFEIPALYHLGRIFAAFPADAAEQVSVEAAPGTAAAGGSVAGTVDVGGRTAAPGRLRGGGGTSFGSLSGWAGGGGPGVRVFGALRFLHLKTVDVVPGVRLPYWFADLYGSAVFGPPARPAGRITLFASRDDVGDRDHGLGWTNALLGWRWRVAERGAASLEAGASAARLAQAGRRVPSLRRTEADVRNDFTRLHATLDLTVTGPRWRLAAGAAGGWRRVENRVAARSFPGRPAALPAADTRLGRAEGAAWAELARHLGPVTLQAGLRTEAAGAVTSLEPRLHARWAVARGVVLGLAAGQTSRPYHLLADARSEPDLEFLDFWLTPGDSVPVTRATHLSADLDLDLAPVLVRLSAFRSRGRGVGELRPETDQRPGGFEYFRFGRARTRGLEVQAALRGGGGHPRSLSVSYVLSRSERDWGAGRVRWAQDRRHQFRAFGQARAGRLTLFGAFDAASGMPLTPLVGFADRLPPGGPDGPLPRYPRQAPLYGPENSVGTAGTARLDAGLAFSFGGPERRRFTLGVSVINLLGTAVAPIAERGEGKPATDRAGRPSPYGRLFDLPPFPTLTLRTEF